MADYHTTADFVLVDTTEQQTNVIASFTFVKNLAEHFNTGYNRLAVSTEAENLNLITHFHAAGLDTTCSNGATASD